MYSIHDLPEYRQQRKQSRSPENTFQSCDGIWNLPSCWWGSPVSLLSLSKQRLGNSYRFFCFFDRALMRATSATDMAMTSCAFINFNPTFKWNFSEIPRMIAFLISEACFLNSVTLPKCTGIVSLTYSSHKFISFSKEVREAIAFYNSPIVLSDGIEVSNGTNVPSLTADIVEVILYYSVYCN